MQRGSGQTKEQEMERMLLWFKAQLPPHDLSEWHVERQPPSKVVELGRHRAVSTWNWDRLEGSGTCVRCGRSWPLDGNNHVYDDAKCDKIVEEAKGWARRAAERDGPCWGDVPRVPDEEGYAVLDLAGAGSDG